MNAIILNDITPRFDVDYGHGSPIRSVGAYRIATALDQIGCKSKVLDYFFHISYEYQTKLLKKYVTHDTKIVGISATNLRGNTKNNGQHSLFDKFKFLGSKSNSIVYYHENLKNIILFLKTNYPNLKIVIGGGQMTNVKKEGLEFIDNYIDCIFTGESDVAIQEYYKYLNGDTSLDYSTEWNLGKFSKSFKKTKVIHSEKNYPLSKEFVASELYIDHKSINSDLLPYEWLFVEISRGCIFNCYFCSYKHSNKRRSVESIREEIIRNYNEFGITKFRLMDDTFNDNKRKVIEICDMFNSLPFEPEWHSYARTDVLSVHPDLIDRMYASGCRYLKFGLESNNNTALKHANKMLDHERNEEVINNIYEKTNGDLYTHSNFIIGLPYETINSQLKTFEWIKSSKLKTFSLTTWHRDKFYNEDDDIKTMSEYGKDEFNIIGYGNEWTHDTMTSTQAYELYHEGYNIFKNNCNPFWIGSDVYPILRSYGIAHKDVDVYMKKIMDLNWNKSNNITSWLENKFLEHTSKYYEKLDKKFNKEDIRILKP